MFNRKRIKALENTIEDLKITIDANHAYSVLEATHTAALMKAVRLLGLLVVCDCWVAQYKEENYEILEWANGYAIMKKKEETKKGKQ